jgi:hypothetical protein
MSLVSEARRQAGETIAQHAAAIAEAWRDAVRADREITGDENLPDLLLTNQVPALVAEIAAALSGDSTTAGDLSLARRRRGLRFGKLRGLARYDAAELYREFKHLRHAIWRLLRQELDAGRSDAFEVMLVIDQYLDEVIGASLRGFFEATDRMSGEELRLSGEMRLPGDAPRPSGSARPAVDPDAPGRSGPGR